MITISSTAKIYANALIETDLSNDIILQDLNLIKDTIQTTGLNEFISNPAISLKIKHELLNDIFSNKINPKILNFIKLITEKGRFLQLNEIIEAYNYETNEINGIKRADIISAVELSEEQKKSVIERLSNKMKKSISANYIIDKSIIGGLVIKIDDNVIDNSLKNKLDRLKR